MTTIGPQSTPAFEVCRILRVLCIDCLVGIYDNIFREHGNRINARSLRKKAIAFLQTYLNKCVIDIYRISRGELSPTGDAAYLLQYFKVVRAAEQSGSPYHVLDVCDCVVTITTTFAKRRSDKMLELMSSRNCDYISTMQAIRNEIISVINGFDLNIVAQNSGWCLEEDILTGLYQPRKSDDIPLDFLPR